MGHARQAVEMLTSADEVQAREIAAYLDLQNRSRQDIERQILGEAMEQVEKQGLDKDECRGLVLAGEGWHSGVIGIVASRIVNRLNRPTVLVATNNGHGQGSGRSIPGFHLAKALQACREYLEGCGGHEMAAGLRLETPKFQSFRDAFCSYATSAISPEMLLPVLHLDCVAELRQVTAALVADLQRLGPFGTGNRKPLLCCQGLEIVCEPRRVGRNGDHLQMLVRQNGTTMKCIGFHLGELFDRVRQGVRVDLAAEPMISEFNGRQGVELEVKDVHFV
jgi:single-stranded-DNA-specific exonuclease